jgi:hypothetical protein
LSTFGGKFKVNATCHLDNYFNKEDLGNGYSDYFSFNPNIGNFSISLHSDLNLQTTAEQGDSLKFDFYSYYFNPVYPATILKDKAQLTQVVRQICNYDMAKEFQPTNSYAAEDGLVTFDDFRSNDNNSVDRTYPRKKFYFVSGTANSIEYADYSRYRFKVTGGFFDDIEIFTDDSKFTSIDYPAKIYFCGYYDVKPNLYGFINSLFGDSGDDSDKIRFYGADLLMAEQQDTLKSFLFDGMACLADLLTFGTEHNVMPHGAR